MGETGKKVVSNIVWKFMERICAQGISFLVTVILARIIMPESYGIIALLSVFILLAEVFVTSGFSASLIQKKNTTDIDYSTMFYCSFAISIILYILMFFLAPAIAEFYNNQDLILIFRVLALKLPISAVNSIQHAYVSKNMIFKKFFFSTLIGTVISGIVGIAMAYNDCGVWALVAQQLVNGLVDIIVLFITIEWKPKLIFSWESVKEQIGYASRIFLADLSGTFFGQLSNFVIGKVYTNADLAYYNRGQQMPSLISNNIGTALVSVLFPAISNEAHNMDKVKSMTRCTVQVLTFIIFPSLIGIAIIAEPLILVLFTEKWSFSIFFVQIFCIAYAIGILGGVSLQTIKAIGRGDVILKLEFIKKPVFVLLLFIGVNNGLEAIAIAMLIYEIYGTIVNVFQLKKYVDYKIKEQLLDIIPALIMTAIMAIIVFVVDLSYFGDVINLIVKIIIGILVYTLLTIIIKPKAYKYSLNMIKDMFKTNNKRIEN